MTTTSFGSSARRVLTFAVVISSTGCGEHDPVASGTRIEDSPSAQVLATQIEAASNPIYALRPTNAGYVAHNRGKGIVASFEGQNLTIRSAGPLLYELRLTPAALVFDGDRVVLADRENSRVDRNSIHFDRPTPVGVLDEWYVNGPLGLEQGFTIPTEPVPGTQQLVVTLDVRGLLDAHATERGVEFVSRATDVAVFAMTEAHAYDATGEALTASLRLSPERSVEVVTDVTDAAYPVVIDPLIWAYEVTLDPGPSSTAADTDGSRVLRAGTTYFRTWTTPAPGTWAFEGDTSHGSGLQVSSEIAGDWVGLTGGTPHSVDMYVYGGGAWTYVTTLRPAVLADDVTFGRFALGIEGSTLVGGAGFHGASLEGAAFVYERVGSTWLLQQTLQSGSPTPSGSFGQYLDLGAGTIVIAAPHEAVTPVSMTHDRWGAVTVLRRTGGVWIDEARLTPGPDDPSSLLWDYRCANSPQRVAASGDAVAVVCSGSPLAEIHMYERTSGTWLETGIIEPPTGATDSFGSRVFLDGDWLVTSDYNLSRVHVYERTAPGVWSLTQTIDPAFVRAFKGGVLDTGTDVYTLQKEDGDVCAADFECASEFCVDGVCCGSACGGGVSDDCLACSVAQGADVDGICAPLDGSSCSDGDACTQTDVCQAATCVGSNPVVCTASDQCHDAGTCDPATGNCSDPAKPDGTPCDDGLFCTGSESCIAGACGSSSGDPCVGPDGDGDCNESCDEAADSCTGADLDGASCDDGVFCNGAETCSSGVCGGSSGDPCAGPDGDANCAESCDEGADSCNASDPDGEVCDDGSFCNGTETCFSGVCGASTGDPCTGADGDGDCAESCDEDADACAAADPDGSSCDDGLFCNGSEICTGGTCGGSTGDPCDGVDGDGDCGESCDEQADTCTGDDADASPCDDGDPCTTSDSCNAGACVAGAPVTCESSSECRAAACDVITGECEEENLADGTPCSVGTCTGGDCVAVGGAGGGVGASGGGLGQGGDGEGAARVSNGDGGSGEAPSSDGDSAPAGCGCRIHGSESPSPGKWPWLAALSMLLWRRPSRRRHAHSL